MLGPVRFTYDKGGIASFEFDSLFLRMVLAFTLNDPAAFAAGSSVYDQSDCLEIKTLTG